MVAKNQVMQLCTIVDRTEEFSNTSFSEAPIEEIIEFYEIFGIYSDIEDGKCVGLKWE